LGEKNLAVYNKGTKVVEIIDNW